MTTKQMLLATLILNAATNTALAIEENTSEYSLTYSTSNKYQSTSCTINADHIVFNAKFKKQSPDGSCSYSGPLLIDQINNAISATNVARNQFGPPTNMAELELAGTIAKLISSDCDCNLLLVAMRNQGNSEKLLGLFNQAANAQKNIGIDITEENINQQQ